MTSFNVTRRILSLGARNSVTGWCLPTFTNATIKAALNGENGQYTQLSAGRFSNYNTVIDVPDVIHEGDEIEDAFTDIYRVLSVRKIAVGDQFIGYRCTADKRQFPNPIAYGTGATVNDSRYNTKNFLQTYLSLALSGVVMFNGVPYPVAKEFVDNDIDVIFIVSPSTSKTELAFDSASSKITKAYKYHEQCPITIYVADKDGANGENMKNQAEQALRTAAAQYPIGAASIRSLGNGKHVPTDIANVYAYEYVLEYYRAEETYDSGVTITYGDNQGSTYTFPNVLNIHISDPDSGDIRTLPPGRFGDYLQILGSSDYDITLTCDLSIAPLNLTWERTQNGAKSDSKPYEVFAEIKFGGKTDTDQIYQNLKLGTGGTIPVRLTSFDVDGTTLTVVFKHYSAANAALGTYSTYYGL